MFTINAQIEAELNSAERTDTKVRYFPGHNEFSGGVEETILLSQASYWWGIQGAAPYYKFLQPCDHGLCVRGDSWTEELGFTRKVFMRARSSVGHKITPQEGDDDKWQEMFRAANKKFFKTFDLKDAVFIIWWTKQDHRTWYAFNQELYLFCRMQIYAGDNPKSKLTAMVKELNPEMVFNSKISRIPIGDSGNFKSPNPHWGFGGIPNGDSGITDTTSNTTPSPQGSPVMSTNDTKEKKGDIAFPLSDEMPVIISEQIQRVLIDEEGNEIDDRDMWHTDPLLIIISGYINPTRSRFSSTKEKRRWGVIRHRVSSNPDYLRYFSSRLEMSQEAGKWKFPGLLNALENMDKFKAWLDDPLAADNKDFPGKGIPPKKEGRYRRRKQNSEERSRNEAELERMTREIGEF